MAKFSKKDDDNIKSPIVKAIVAKNTSTRPAAYDKSGKLEVETSQVVHTEVKPTTPPTRSVEYDTPQIGDPESFYRKDTRSVAVESPSPYSTDTKEVVITDRALDQSGDTPEVIAVTTPHSIEPTPQVTAIPGVYDPEERDSIEFNRTTIYDTKQRKVTAIQDEYELPEGPNQVRVITNDNSDAIVVGKSKLMASPEYERPTSAATTTIPKPATVFDNFLSPPVSGNSGVTTDDLGKIEISGIAASVGDKSLKGELSNFHSYMYDEWTGMPSVYDIADTLGSKLGLGKVSDDWESFTYGMDLVKSIHDKRGGSWFESAMLALEQVTAKPVKSDAVVPLANKIVDCIPIVSMFTKKKYSLNMNKETYAHEKDYETKRTWLGRLLGLASAGVCGVYYNAAYYANHNIPNDQVDYIIRRLAGDPEASAPAAAILAEEKEMQAKARLNGGDLFIMNKLTQTEYVGIDEAKGVGKKLNSFKNVFTQKKYKFDEGTKRISPDNYEVVGPNKIITGESQCGRDEWHGSDIRFKHPDNQGVPTLGLSARFIGKYGHHPSASIGKAYMIDDDSQADYWKMAVAISGYNSTDNTATSTIIGPMYFNPDESQTRHEFNQTEAIMTLSDYQKYLQAVEEADKRSARQDVDTDDYRYGMLPYRWDQVFKGFEISSTGNWNVSLCEFKGDASLFVPKGRPTYGPWHYMPIISYEYVDKELQTTSIEVAQSLSLMIPSANTFVSTLQITFLDDRFDRIYNWFAAYSNNIYGTYDGYAKPYKNCCIKITIDILDWDRTILKRMRLAAIPINFSQQHSGDSSDNYKTVSVTFSVVGEVYSDKSDKGNRLRPIQSELKDLQDMKSVANLQ